MSIFNNIVNNYNIPNFCLYFAENFHFYHQNIKHDVKNCTDASVLIHGKVRRPYE